MPENLQVVGKYTATYKFRTLDEDIYNKIIHPRVAIDKKYIAVQSIKYNNQKSLG